MKDQRLSLPSKPQWERKPTSGSLERSQAQLEHNFRLLFFSIADSKESLYKRDGISISAASAVLFTFSPAGKF